MSWSCKSASRATFARRNLEMFQPSCGIALACHFCARKLQLFSQSHGICVSKKLPRANRALIWAREVDNRSEGEKKIAASRELQASVTAKPDSAKLTTADSFLSSPLARRRPPALAVALRALRSRAPARPRGSGPTRKCQENHAGAGGGEQKFFFRPPPCASAVPKACKTRTANSSFRRGRAPASSPELKPWLKDRFFFGRPWMVDVLNPRAARNRLATEKSSKFAAA